MTEEQKKIVFHQHQISFEEYQSNPSLVTNKEISF